MSVHQLGERGPRNSARSKGSARNQDHSIRHSERMREGARSVRESRAERKAESSRQSAQTNQASDRYDPAIGRGRRGGSTTIIYQQNFYYDSNGSESADRPDSTSSFRASRADRRGGHGHHARHHGIPEGVEPYRHVMTNGETNPAASTESTPVATVVGDATIDAPEFSPVSENANGVDDSSAVLNRRQTRRLNRIQRRADRMMAHGFGDRAIAKVERHIGRIEARMENGTIDMDKGKAYSESLKTILTDLQGRMAPTAPIDSDGDTLPTVEATPNTPFNELPEGLQESLRKFHAFVSGFEKLGDTKRAGEMVEGRIRFIQGKADAGYIQEKHAADFVKTLEYIGSQIGKVDSASPDSTSAAAGSASANATGQTVADSDNGSQFDWEPWNPGPVTASDKPMRDLPRGLRRWAKAYGARAMSASDSGNVDKARGMIQNRLDWVKERGDAGIMNAQHAADLTAVLERMMTRVTPSDSAGSMPEGSNVPGSDRSNLIVANAESGHRTQMYSYASRQYGMGS